jgi:hypothetical protein
MLKNWKTSLMGVLFFVTQIAPVLHSGGLSVGHFGGSDFLQVSGALSGLLLGLYAKDHNVTGGTSAR